MSERQKIRVVRLKENNGCALTVNNSKSVFFKLNFPVQLSIFYRRNLKWIISTIKEFLFAISQIVYLFIRFTETINN